MTDSDSWPAQNWLTTEHDKLDQVDTPAVTDVRHMLQSRQVAQWPSRVLHRSTKNTEGVRISKKTRVLVLAQSRLRPHSHHKLYNNRIAFSNANFDWIEMMFQQQLHRSRATNQTTQGPCAFTQSSAGFHHKYGVMDYHRRGMGSGSPEKDREKAAFIKKERGQVTEHVTPPQNEAGFVRSEFNRKDIGQVKSVSKTDNKEKVKSEPQGKGTEEVNSRLHLKEVEQVRSGSLRTKTVNVMSTLKDTEHNRSVLLGKSIVPGRGRQMVTRTFRDHLVPQESGDGGGLWWWDTFLPLNQAEISECEELYKRGLTNHPLYKSNLLLCKDPHHAGGATTHDLVTMILNLLCNSVLALPSTYCCN
nr:uncharacterized protein LOC128694388 [Cherax quadricarinatus]